MALLALLENGIPDSVLNGLGEPAGEVAGQAGEAVMQFAGNPTVLIGGIVLVVVAVLLFLFLKKIIINSILGVGAWVILTYVFQVELPLIPSLAVSVIFGLAGIGAMLVLRFFGLF